MKLGNAKVKILMAKSYMNMHLKICLRSEHRISIRFILTIMVLQVLQILAILKILYVTLEHRALAKYKNGIKSNERKIKSFRLP